MKAYNNAKKKLAKLEMQRHISPYFWRQWEATKKKLAKLERKLQGQQTQIFNQQ